MLLLSFHSTLYSLTNTSALASHERSTRTLTPAEPIVSYKDSTATKFVGATVVVKSGKFALGLASVTAIVPKS